MFRDVGAVLAGTFVGMLVNMGIINLNMMMFPVPDGLDMEDPVAFAAYFSTLPVAALLVAMAAHLNQAFVGGWVAARLSEDHSMRVAMVVGVVSQLGGAAAIAMFEPPLWMWIEIPLYLVVAWAAGTLELRRRGTS